ncbi:hypothetical protein ACQEVF_59720 [Nonomuraea polychroma]|uniref:hypothetical protein n=1 Tax=Nonomuraea polychroma TaxID=46176 RepID=UPI003D927494
MTAGPARRRGPVKAVPEPPPEPPPAPPTKSEKFGRRWFEFAAMLMIPEDDRKKFADLMYDIAEDFQAGALVEADFFDRMREATDLLPMSKKTALEFATKVYGVLKKEMGDR